MSDSGGYVSPSQQFARYGGSESGPTALKGNDLALRTKIVYSTNPWMADRPDAVAAMVRSPVPTETLPTVSAEMYGRMTADTFKDQLDNMKPALQRAVWQQLSPAQQSTLSASGYAIPHRGGNSLIENVLDRVGDVIRPVTGGIGAVVSPVVNPALHGLMWLNDQPGHVYRATRLAEADTGWASVIGAGVGVGLGLATRSGSGFLVNAGKVGLAATAGAAAGGLLYNGNDWARAWNESWNGERTFDRPSRRRANEILDDPRVLGLAQDLARLDGFKLSEFLDETAGLRDRTIGSQTRLVSELATQFGEQGTEGHAKAVDIMTRVLHDPKFQEAVVTLQHGKISVGRDLADTLGLEPDSTLYTIVSGAADGLWAVTVDPTLMLGGAAKLWRARRAGIPLAEGSVGAARFLEISENVPGVTRYHTEIARAVNERNFERLRRFAPEMRESWEAMLDYRNTFEAGREFTVDSFREWMTGNQQLAPILAGQGTVRGASGIVLKGLSPQSLAYRHVASRMRSFTHGLTDARTEAYFRQLVDEVSTDPAMRTDFLHRQLPDELHGYIDTETGLITGAWRYNEMHPGARLAGRGVGKATQHVPGLNALGDILTSITTMIPPGKAIALAGPDAARDIHAVTELGRYTGMPEWARHAWRDAALNAPSVGPRANAMVGFLDNMLTMAGGRLTERGEQLTDEFLERMRQIYGQGDIDKMLVRGHRMPLGLYPSDMANEIVMPDLHQLYRAAHTGALARFVGLTELNVVEGAMNRVWKPAVLLRAGFILRAGGEEMLNFMLRGGIGSIAQEMGAANLGRYRTWRRAYATRMENPYAVLSESEQRILRDGPLPAHLRPLAHILDRVSWAHPAVDAMEKYGLFVERALRDGLGQGERIEGLITGIGGRALGSPRAGLDLADRLRLNVAESTSALLFGGRNSWRRMVLGGVDDELVTAMDHFYRWHETAIMREISATSASPWDPGVDQTNVATFMEERNGKLRPVRYHMEKSRFRRLAKGDAHFDATVHGQMTRLLNDPIIRDAAAPIVSRIRPHAADWSEEATERIGRVWDGISERTVQRVINEFMGKPNRRNLDAMIASLEVANPELASLFKMRLPANGPVGFDLVADVVREWAAPIRQDWAANIVAQLPAAREVVAHLDTLSPATRAWTGQYLRGRVAGGQRLTDADQALAMSFHTQEHVAFAHLRDTTFADEPELMEDFARAMGDGDLSTLSRDQLQAVQAKLDHEIELSNARIDAAEERGTISVAFGGDESETWAAHLEDLRNMVRRATSGRRFYTNLDDAADDLRQMLRIKFQDPHYQELFAHQTQRLGDDSPFRSGRVNVYVAPDLMMSVDAMASLAVRPQLILDNRDVLEVMLARQAEEKEVAVLLANKELVDELHTISARDGWTNFREPTEYVDLDREVVDGRYHDDGNLRPVHKRGKQTQAWTIDPETIRTRIQPVPIEAEERIGEWADTVVERMRQVWQRNSKELVTPRMRPLNDGLDEPLVYQVNAAGKSEPVPRGTHVDGLDTRQQFHDAKGRPVMINDPDYFEALSANAEAGGDLLWESLGPMMEDAWDDLYAHALYVPKQEMALQAGQMQPSGDIVRSFRSRVSDIADTPGMPNFAVGPTLTAPKGGAWGEFVRYGFDRVIGPSIDALARKPMARHFFIERFRQNRHAMAWMLDPDLEQKTSRIVGRVLVQDPADAQWMAETARQLAHVDGYAPTRQALNDGQALAWLRSHTTDDEWKLLTVRTRHLAEKELASSTLSVTRTRELNDTLNRIKQLAQRRPQDVAVMLRSGATHGEFLALVRSRLPEGIPEEFAKLRLGRRGKAIENDPLLKQFTDDDWRTIVAAENDRNHVEILAGELAATSAIGDMMPFIDSHELRTQWAEFGKGFLPFWYAEENFLKRWARTMILDPASIQKAQLTYMGLKHAGVVHTDEQGTDWFVYPGSQLVQQGFSAIMPGSLAEGVGGAFRTPTESLLPGLNRRFGAPSFGPSVSIPMNVVTGLFPQLQPVERGLLGDYGSTRNVIEQFAPSFLVNTLTTLVSADEGNARYASALNAAAQHLYAAGNGPPENATPAELDAFIRRLREHAHIIVTAQAFGGFFAPGAPSQTESATQDGGLLGIGGVDPGEVLGSLYMRLIRDLGIEAGTAKYLELYPDAQLKDIVNPMAYTVGQSESTSGAYLPPTERALEFFTEHEDYFAEFPEAAPWLLPQPPAGSTERSRYAADQYVTNGLRVRRTSEDFLRAMMFKEAAGPYFAASDRFTAAIAEAEAADDTDRKKMLTETWAIQAETFKRQHPIFAEELVEGTARRRRLRTIDQMRTVVHDPEAPPSEQTKGLKLMIDSFDNFSTRRKVLADDRTAKGRDTLDQWKNAYSEYMEAYVVKHPEMATFWKTVIRPQAELD